MLPIILVRGFDLLGGSAADPFHGWNEGTVNPHKLGDNYIYEGMVVRFLKTELKLPQDQGSTTYLDATNALNYAASTRQQTGIDPNRLARLKTDFGHLPESTLTEWLTGRIWVDETIAKQYKGKHNTFWVFRYYDFAGAAAKRSLEVEADGLAETIERVLAITGAPSVYLICHSMGGVIARCMMQRTYLLKQKSAGLNMNDDQFVLTAPPAARTAAKKLALSRVAKWITMGTPHRGVPFQVVPTDFYAETEYFNAEFFARKMGKKSDDKRTPDQFLGDTKAFFDPERVLCVVGTNHRAYGGVMGSVTRAANQVVSWLQGKEANHSDGLIKQSSAALAGAYKAFVHKPHTGRDSLISCRESFELAARFLFGDVRVRLRLESLTIRRSKKIMSRLGQMLDGKPEYFIGFSVKPRRVDFFLNQMTKDSENCFGPFSTEAIKTDQIKWDKEDKSKDGVVFEGVFNSALANFNPKTDEFKDLAYRVDIYIGERDSYLLGFSDTKIVDDTFYMLLVNEGGALKAVLVPNDRGTNAGMIAQPLVNNRCRFVVPSGLVHENVAMTLSLEIDPSQSALMPTG